MAAEIQRAATPDLIKLYKGHKSDIPRFAGQSLNQVVLCSDLLREEEFDFDVAKLVVWTVDAQLAAHVDALCDFHRGKPGLGARVYMGVMSRLVEFRRPPIGNTKMTFQPSAYFNHVATNLSMECIPAGWTQSVRVKYEPGPKLTELSASRCSNHLGLDGLLVTGDGKLVIPKRTAQVAVNRGMHSASASGAFEFEPKPGATQNRSALMIHTPFHGLIRELEEELAMESKDVRLLLSIGLTRDLVWGGKPQMFFYCESGLSEGEIESRIQAGAARDAAFENERRAYYQFSGLEPKQQKALLEDIADDPNSAPTLKTALYFLWRNLDVLRSKGARMLQ